MTDDLMPALISVNTEDGFVPDHKFTKLNIEEFERMETYKGLCCDFAKWADRLFEQLRFAQSRSGNVWSKDEEDQPRATFPRLSTTSLLTQEDPGWKWEDNKISCVFSEIKEVYSLRVKEANAFGMMIQLKDPN